MAEVFCSNHPQIGAVGKCSRCAKSFCLDCLDVETGKVLCGKCLTSKPVEAPPAPPVFTPPVFVPPVSPAAPKVEENTLISLDDLMVPKVEPVAPKMEETLPPVQADLPPAAPPAFKLEDHDPLGLFKTQLMPPTATPSTPSPAPQPFSGLPSTVSPEPKPFEVTPVPSAPSLSKQPPLEKPSHVPDFDLAGMMKKLDGLEPPDKTAAPPSKSQVEAQDKVSVRDLHALKRSAFYPLRAFAGVLSLKFELLAAKLRIPGYLLLILLLALVAGGVLWGMQQASAPAIKIVDSIQPIHIIPIDVSQVNDLDITAFSDIQNHLGSLGFTQVLQMTVPQLPSPNFFDIGLKEDSGTYSEILKIPNQIGPRVSFVTVFTNGVWYSTNGWAGTGQQLDSLVSEFYPDQTPEQLYDQHAQGIQKLQTANGWEIQKTSSNRYMAALSDHLRWFLALKNILPYQADFASWH